MRSDWGGLFFAGNSRRGGNPPRLKGPRIPVWGIRGPACRKGLDVSGRADLSIYADAGQVSPYAVDAMAWAVHTGLITGVDSTTLQPGGSAVRAQVATILMRFCQYAQAH